MYQFTYTTVNPMPIGAGFMIDYPSYVSPQTQLVTSVVIFRSVTYPMGYLVDTVNQKIRLTKGLSVAVPAGSRLIIQVQWIVNP